ncbi:hypothetical protein LDC_1306, partial [sediment metagenome]
MVSDISDVFFNIAVNGKNFHACDKVFKFHNAGLNSTMHLAPEATTLPGEGV